MSFVNIIIKEKHQPHTIVEAICNNFQMPLNESDVDFFVTEESVGLEVENVTDEYIHALAESLFDMGYNDFDIDIEEDFDNVDEITLEDDDDFHQIFGYLAYSLDENDLFEAEYRGRKVKLNKPMAGDVKKFKVYVNCPGKGGKKRVKKINFGQKGVKIKKSNPKRRKSFRARHNCDNPGPKCKARYWSCRKW